MEPGPDRGEDERLLLRMPRVAALDYEYRTPATWFVARESPPEPLSQ
jgi:hypothetical protein